MEGLPLRKRLPKGDGLSSLQVDQEPNLKHEENGLPLNELGSPLPPSGTSPSNELGEPSLKKLKEEQLEPSQDPPVLYCICRRPDDPATLGFMIGCDVCDQWYHGICVHISQMEASNITSWLCPRCDPRQFSSVKCRMCSSFAKLGSKYCSDQCGKKWARQASNQRKAEQQKEQTKQSIARENEQLVHFKRPTELLPGDEKDLFSIDEINLQLSKFSAQIKELETKLQNLNLYLQFVENLEMSEEEISKATDEEMRLKKKRSEMKKNPSESLLCPWFCEEHILLEELDYHKEECFVGKKEWKKSIRRIPTNRMCGFPFVEFPTPQNPSEWCHNRRVSCVLHPNWIHYKEQELQIQWEQLEMQISTLVEWRISLQKRIAKRHQDNKKPI